MIGARRYQHGEGFAVSEKPHSETNSRATEGQFVCVTTKQTTQIRWQLLPNEANLSLVQSTRVILAAITRGCEIVVQSWQAQWGR